MANRPPPDGVVGLARALLFWQPEFDHYSVGGIRLRYRRPDRLPAVVINQSELFPAQGSELDEECARSFVRRIS